MKCLQINSRFVILSRVGAIWRDSGDWERLRTTWHAGGMMQTTWFYGTGDEFVVGSQAAFNRGIEVLHTLSGTSVDVEGNRAIAQTKMAINQRAIVNGTVCDCVCMGRFYDFLEKREGSLGHYAASTHLRDGPA